MIGLIQRVTQASVEVEGEKIASISQGLLVLLGVEKGDDEVKANKLINKILSYRVFEDEAGKMNLSLKDIHGELLLVPQFTLAADTNSGMRPSFSSAAEPADASWWFDYVVKESKRVLAGAQAGRFGADMRVSLLNNGPVTFWLQT